MQSELEKMSDFSLIAHFRDFFLCLCSKTSLVQNLSNENEFDLHKSEPAGRIHFHINGRFDTMQRQKATQSEMAGIERIGDLNDTRGEFKSSKQPFYSTRSPVELTYPARCIFYFLLGVWISR